MPNKKQDKVPEYNGFKQGNVQFPYEIQVDVAGHNLTLTYWLPVYELTVKEYIEAKLAQLNRGELTQEAFTFEVRKVQAQGRYIPLNLPEQMVVGTMRLQDRIWKVPLPSIAWQLYQAIKKCNPMDRGREGNTNQIVFPEGNKTSIGSFCGLVLGISQSRLADTGGISGGYSPCKAFEGLIPHGYSAMITSTSPQYDKVVKMLQAREAQAKQELKAQPSAHKARKAQRGK